MDKLDLDRAVQVARRAVTRASEALLARFGRGVAVERKPDRSPVTEADRMSEAAIVEEIQAAFPGHAILGEEEGLRGEGTSRWIVDPLDGTRGFTRGGSFWGPLVALEHEGRIVAGAMALPVLGQTYWAGLGMGAWRNGTRLRVSNVARLADATLAVGELKALLAPRWRDGVSRLVDEAESTRCPGDLAGCAMVLDGRAECWLEAGVQIWDLAPLMILVEEAGGRFTDFSGAPTVASGNAVASNGLVHARVLAELR